MRNLFNLDGPVLQFINTLVYSVYLNILWFICCIPIVVPPCLCKLPPHCNNRGINHRAFLCHIEDSQE